MVLSTGGESREDGVSNPLHTMKETYIICTELGELQKIAEHKEVPTKVLLEQIYELTRHIGTLEMQMRAMQLPIEQRCRICAEHWNPVSSVIIGLDGTGRCVQHANYP